jgi:hypothetical protein
VPLQNRVTPFGDLIAVPERGTFTGNRGILHTPERKIVRHHVGRRWIVCQLEFRGWHRDVMQPNRWTELFFLDEATALAAGHRPCATCRHADYQAFRQAWVSAHGGVLPSADELDRRMHQDRMAAPRIRRTWQATIKALPDGAFILVDGEPWLIWASRVHRWSPGGYDRHESLPIGDVTVLTPVCTVWTITAGYVPVVHDSAG